MPEIPEPTVTVASYRVSCLPEGHPDRRHFALAVTYRIRGDKAGFVVTDGVDYYAADGSPQENPVLFAENEALALAKGLAPRMVVNGKTVADVLAWRAR